jgi:hypothetical protein
MTARGHLKVENAAIAKQFSSPLMDVCATHNSFNSPLFNVNVTLIL